MSEPDTVASLLARFLALFAAADFSEMNSIFSPTATYRISGPQGDGPFWRGRSTLLRALRTIRQHMKGAVEIKSNIVETRCGTTTCIWSLVSEHPRGVPYHNSGTLTAQVAHGVIVAVEETLDLSAFMTLVGDFDSST